MSDDEAADVLLGDPDHWLRHNTLDYERVREAELLQAVRLFKGEHLLVRRPFGWHLDGKHIPNAAEHFSREGVCLEHGWDVVCDFGEHIAVVVKSKPRETR